MPTITIDTGALRPSRRLAISVRLTRWLADRHVEPSHVVVRFREMAGHSVFSGGLPLAALASGRDGPPSALVTCCVGPERDDTFRDGLAREIASALGATEGMPFLYIEFRPTSPANVYVARHGRLSRADALATDNGTR